MPAISAVIVATNEERRLGDAVRSVLPWADEVLVVDGGSDDGTAALAASLGARVEHRRWDGFVSSKAAATAMASHDLILALDADERADAELGMAARLAAEQDVVHDAWRVRRLNYLGGVPLRATGWYPDLRIRLFDRRKAWWTGADPHDVVCCPGRVGELDGHLHHDPERTTEAYVAATWAHAARGAASLRDAGVAPGPLTPWLHGGAHLVRKVVAGRCWIDGRRGWTVAWTGARGTARKYRLARDPEAPSA